MRKLMPVLKPSNYRKEDELFFKKQLFDNSASPVVVYGFDNDNVMVYEGASSEEDYGNRLPDLIQESLLNLKEVNPKIQIDDVVGDTIAFVTDHEYASEKIMDVEFMKSLSEKIKADRLMVGIPFQGVLIAVKSESQISLKFPSLVKQYFETPQQDPISKYVFMVEEGEIVAMGGSDLEDEKNQDFQIRQSATTLNYEVRVNCESIDELTTVVNSSFQEIMAMVISQKSFGGKITFHISDSIPLTDKLVEKCNGYIEQIEKNEMAKTLIQAFSDSELKIDFYYEEKEIAASKSNSEEIRISAFPKKKKWWQFWK